MASATFRIGLGSSSSGPWTWGDYDTAVDAGASAHFKVQLESTAGVDTVSCVVSSADEATLVAGVPTVTIDSATRTGVGQLLSTVGATYIVRVTTNPSMSGAETSELAIHVPLSSGARLFALDETDQASRTYSWVGKLNAVVRLAGTGASSGVTWAGDLAGSSDTSQTVVGLRSASIPALSAGYLHYTGTALEWATLLTLPSGSANNFLQSNGSAWYANANPILSVGSSIKDPTGNALITAGTSAIGFLGGSAVAKQTVGGSALQDAIHSTVNALEAYGLVTDSVSASLTVPAVYVTTDPDVVSGPLVDVDTVQAALTIIDSCLETGWLPLPSWVATAPSASTLTIAGTSHKHLPPGMALRLLDLCPAFEMGVSEATSITLSFALTGSAVLVETLAANGGRLRLSVVYAGEAYTVYVYDRLGTTLLAHSATYTTTATVALTADNGSGVTGTVAVNALYAVSATTVQVYKYAQVTGCTTTLATLLGKALSTTSGAIYRVWYGPDKVEQWDYVIPASIATSPNTDQLTETKQPKYWRGPPAHLVSLICQAYTASDATINVSTPATYALLLSRYTGVFTALSLTSAETLYTSATIAASRPTQIEYGEQLSMPTTESTAGTSYPSGTVTLVLE